MRDWIRDEPNIDDKWHLMFSVFSLCGMGPMSLPVDSGWRCVSFNHSLWWTWSCSALEVWSVHPDVVLSRCLYIELHRVWRHGHSRRYLGQAHSQQHRATPTSSPGSLRGTAALDKVQLQWHEGPHGPKSWPARSPGKVAKGGSNVHTAAEMHMYHQMDAQPGAQEGSALTRGESRALGRLLEHPTPRCLLKDPRNRGWGDKSKGSGWGAVTRKWQPDPGLIPQPHIRVRVICHMWGGELSLSQGWQLGKPTPEGVIVNSVTSVFWDGLPTEAHDIHTDVPVSPCEPHCTQVRKHRLKTKFISTVK